MKCQNFSNRSKKGVKTGKKSKHHTTKHKQDTNTDIHSYTTFILHSFFPFSLNFLTFTADENFLTLVFNIFESVTH